MRYVSTRGAAPPVGLSDAMLAGLAPDGGLYVPERFPRLDPDAIDPAAPFAEQAARLLAPFAAGDPLGDLIHDLCRDAFDFPLPLEPLDQTTAVLELFHGPTAAFKDFGARFLAASLARIADAEGDAAPTRTILVATSGDTGGAVAAAFWRRPRVRVGVLYPAGGVSPRQEHQLTCWGDNVHAFAVDGTFDDCQRVVKAAFRDEAWRTRAGLTSANSINIGRLLPQCAYYLAASVRRRAAVGRDAGFVVPAGNMGNALGAFWARALGFPIHAIALPTNANRVVPDWFRSGEWSPRSSVATLANAMDVGDPSNMERLFHLYEGDASEIRRVATSLSVDDETIRRTIAARPWGRVWCPHTATAVHMRPSLGDGDWVIVATAHPAKFETIVEPLIGGPVGVPPALAELLERPAEVTRIAPDLAALQRCLDA